MSEERTVPLTDDQFDRMWHDELKIRHAGEILGAAVMAVADKVARMEQLKWEAVRNLTNATADESPTIDWASRCVRLKKIEK